MLDCLIIGGGIAGLTAATYLARFRRDIRVIDDFSSRAALIPLSHNYPGFPEGIPGKTLLNNLRQQANRYGVEVINGTIKRLNKHTENTFLASSDNLHFEAKYIIIATGLVDIEPELPNVKNAIARGLIRHCPVCDGFEVINQRIGILGYGIKAVKEALFLKTYTEDISLIAYQGRESFSEEEIALAKENNIKIFNDPIHQIILEGDKITGLCFETEGQCQFDTIYSALGARMRNDLCLQMNAKCNDLGCLLVDEHQTTSIPGIYAIGDIVEGLNQMCVAQGQAAIAASAIHQKLA